MWQQAANTVLFLFTNEHIPHIHFVAPNIVRLQSLYINVSTERTFTGTMSGDIDCEQTQIFQFHPKYDLNEEVIILSHLHSQPSPLASFVLPAFRFFRVLGMCPSSFKFDKESHKFEHVKGSWIRTVRINFVSVNQLNKNSQSFNCRQFRFYLEP